MLSSKALVSAITYLLSLVAQRVMISQFPLNNQSASAHNLAVSVQDDQDMVPARARLHLIESVLKLIFRDLSHMRQDSQHIQEAMVEIASLERSDRVALRER